MTSPQQTGNDATGAAQLVAHRGYARHFPENTMEAVEAAWRAGACYIEVDVQLTSDRVPVLFHDVELDRTTGASGRVTETAFEDLRKLHAGEPERLGERFTGTLVPALAELAERLGARAGTEAFVEIKRESLEAFGTESVLARVLADLAPVLERCIVISSDRDATRRARELGAARIGWVLPAYDPKLLDEAETDRVDYLFLNRTRLPPPPQSLRRGPWRWALYEIDDPETATALLRRGADLIETMAIGELLAHPPQSQNERYDR